MAYWGFKAILSPIFFLFWRVKTVGRHNVPKKGAVVLAANHQSFCDSFFLPLVLVRKVTYLAKAEYFDRGRTAWFFRAAGQIPIHRSGGDVSQRALDTAKEVLDSGRILGLYPEGTRSPDEHVWKGRTGVARLALECGVPVVPVGLLGTTEIQPVGKNYMIPFKRATVRFGEPMWLRPADVEGRDLKVALREFTDRLMAEIARLSERPYIDEYVPKSARSATGIDS